MTNGINNTAAKFNTLIVAAAKVRPGDFIPAAGARVTGIQKIGPLVIVDFDDNTATAPMPGNIATTVHRPAK